MMAKEFKKGDQVEFQLNQPTPVGGAAKPMRRARPQVARGTITGIIQVDGQVRLQVRTGVKRGVMLEIHPEQVVGA